MNRRFFTRHLGLAAFLPVLGKGVSLPSQPAAPPSLVKPPRLKPGDKVGLITPGSFIPDRTLEKAIANIRNLGFEVVLGKHIRAKRGYIAGTDRQRLDDLHTAFANPDIRAVWCARGGYGCTRLLPEIEYELIAKNPKVLIGYSDITALHLAIHQQTGLVTFHGPVAGSDFTAYTASHVKAVLLEAKAPHVIQMLSDHGEVKNPELYKSQVLRPGRVKGPLSGGNLSLLAAMAGTGFGLNAAGKLIFMEDIDEKPYRIDRMLTQLRQSANLDQAAAFALGIFAGCVPEPGDESLTLAETVADRLSDLGRPAVYGLTFGHIANQCTLPMGIQAELDTDSFTLTLLEAGVE
ncbi:MAG: LD-carboxypeptidase [Haliscomenobacter sp.]|nr:LD-carboxypeptidase [Haliscomenobacter sp.]